MEPERIETTDPEVDEFKVMQEVPDLGVSVEEEVKTDDKML